MSDEAQKISFRRKQEKKALDRRGELLYQWDESLPEIDKDIIRLELLELDIRPYSLNWRFGIWFLSVSWASAILSTLLSRYSPRSLALPTALFPVFCIVLSSTVLYSVACPQRRWKPISHGN